MDFRLIAACNRDFALLMDEGRFRRDLYHRLNEVTITLPPLCERKDEIPALVKHFLIESDSGIENTRENADDIERLGVILSVHDYPGNVRELKARVKDLVHSSDGDLAALLRLALDYNSLGKRELLSRLLDFTNWNQSRTAWIYGVSEGTVRNRIRKYGLTRA